MYEVKYTLLYRELQKFLMYEMISKFDMDQNTARTIAICNGPTNLLNLPI